MNDKLTIELLCEMLEKQGLNCHTHYLHAFWWVGPKLYEAADNLDGTLTVGRLTPEQAIAATMGSGTCELVEEHIGIADSWPYHLKCSSCGAVFDYFDCYHKTGRIGLTMKHCKQCGRKVDE